MNIDTSTLTFGMTNDIVILGSNPEMADMSNPQGNIEGLSHYIVGEAPDGRRFVHSAFALTHNGYAENDMTIERLKRLVDYLNANHPALDPYHWEEMQAAYGSEAYQRDGWEAASLWRELDDACVAGEISHCDAQSIYHGRRLS